MSLPSALNPETTTELTDEVKKTFSIFQHMDFISISKVILTAALLLVICLIVKSVLIKAMDRILDRSRIEKNLHAFLRSCLKILLWFITVMIVAGAFGIDATSLVAVLSIAGLAISLSIQGSLSNLASGITLILTKPFVVGDLVEIAGITGEIIEIGMVYTKLNTVDNRRVVIPNSNITAKQVINYTTEKTRRIEINITASYDAPIEQVKSVIMTLLSSHPKALSVPEPFVRVLSYGDHAIEYAVRVWSNNEDYYDLQFDIMEQIKLAFDENGIDMTYPHLNVHMIS
ncbi:MAG: mechanosensitive ion channel [Evtepia sp.]